MSQLALLAPPKPPSPLARGIDLRCCDTLDLMASLPDGSIDLTIADPPWLYDDQPHDQATMARDHYDCLPIATIAEHVNAAARLSKRLALWTTGPFVQPWLDATRGGPWGPLISMGAWHKSGLTNDQHVGIGYHWTGCMEPVLLYVKKGAPIDRHQFLRNAWSEPPGAHSRKPVAWMVQWLRRWVPPGGAVLDVYAGLGSVAEAVLLAGDGRQYVGAEIDPERHAAALALLAQARA